MAGKTKSEKTFDCIHYKRQVQSDIYEQIKGMSHEQEIAYFQQQAGRGALAQWWNRIKARDRSKTVRQAGLPTRGSGTSGRPRAHPSSLIEHRYYEMGQVPNKIEVRGLSQFSRSENGTAPFAGVYSGSRFRSTFRSGGILRRL